MKIKLKAVIILSVLGILLIPAVKLLFILISSLPKSYNLEIENYENTISRYSFDKLANNENPFQAMASKKLFGKHTGGQQQLDNFYDEMMKQYKVEEDLVDVDGVYTRDLKLKEVRELNEIRSIITENIVTPVLGERDEDIIGDLSQLKVLHNFDDTGIDKIDRDISGSLSDQIANNLDQEGKEELDTYINEKYLKNYQRQPSSLRVFNQNKFYTSPMPDNSKLNSDDTLNKLKLVMGKDNYYCFEVIRFNIITDSHININDLKAYVVRGDYILPNVGGKNDIFFKYRRNEIVSTTALGYNPPPGTYKIVVKSRSNPNWKGTSASFKLTRRKVPKLKKGFSVVNLEHTIPLNTTRVKGPNGWGGYEEIANWVKYMDADAFWMLVAQTTGWDASINPKDPWVPGGFKNLALLGPAMKKKNIQVGAYIMSYFTPGNGKKKVGYDPSLGYIYDGNKLQDSYHVSLNCEKRFQDIVKIAKTFEDNPHVDYIGMDFIRTGRADGYEMGPLVVEDMNIHVPEEYSSYSYTDKVKWFAQQIEHKKNQVIIRKWRWWRATKTAGIINRLITEGDLTKPVWCFTLGWEHGKQHGQDPYMMFDAGALIDAVMLYEASEGQFKNMMVQWRNYMRDNANNVMIGNASDVRLLESSTRNAPADFIYRQVKGYRNVYRNGLAKGIFFHDISRALWSSKRGIDIKEWAIVNGHSISKYRQELGMIPYSAKIKLNADARTGKIKIKNHTDKIISGLRLSFVDTGNWVSATDKKERLISLQPNKTIQIPFKAVIKPERESIDTILGYVITHKYHPKYFFFTQRSKIDYEKYMLASVN